VLKAKELEQLTEIIVQEQGKFNSSFFKIIFYHFNCLSVRLQSNIPHRLLHLFVCACFCLFISWATATKSPSIYKGT